MLLSEVPKEQIVCGTVIRLLDGGDHVYDKYDNCGSKYAGRIGIIYRPDPKTGVHRWITASGYYDHRIQEFGTYNRDCYEVLGQVPVVYDHQNKEDVWRTYSDALLNNSIPPGMVPLYTPQPPGMIPFNHHKESAVSSLNINVSVVETIDGWVGQVRSVADNKIIWQSEPLQDEKDAEGAVTKPAATVASEAASGKVTEVLKGLFT